MNKCFVFFPSLRVLQDVQGRLGFTLIEVVLVMAIIAISLALAGPRIGAGLGTVELREAEQMVKSGLQFARVRARRSDNDCFVVLDNLHRSLEVLGPDMKVLREQRLPSSVSFVLQPPLQTVAMEIAPSGIASGDAVLLRGRNGEVKVSLR